MPILARISRIVPLLILLAVIAVIVYFVMSFRYSSSRAKATLIKVFTWLNGVLTIVFVLVALYALIDKNEVAAELSLSFGVVTLIGLGITRLCNHVFKKNHPHYSDTVTQATVINESIATRFSEAFKRALGQAFKETFSRKK